MRYWIGTICAASLLLLLPACEQHPPRQPKPPVAKVESPDTSRNDPRASQNERAGKEYAAELMTAASYVGGLIACINADYHHSVVAEDSYFRLRNLMHATSATRDPNLVEVFDIGYMIYLKTIETGVVFKIKVPREDNPEAKFKVDAAVIIASKAECLMVEDKVLEWRKKGGMLDVEPYGPSAKGDTL